MAESSQRTPREVVVHLVSQLGFTSYQQAFNQLALADFRPRVWMSMYVLLERVRSEPGGKTLARQSNELWTEALRCLYSCKHSALNFTFDSDSRLRLSVSRELGLIVGAGVNAKKPNHALCIYPYCLSSQVAVKFGGNGTNLCMAHCQVTAARPDEFQADSITEPRLTDFALPANIDMRKL